MNFISYIKDKLLLLVLYILMNIILLLVFILYKVNIVLIIFVLLVMFIMILTVILTDYHKRKIFYSNIDKKLLEIDKKYLISEVIKYSSFIDSKLLLDYLYMIDKSYIESVNNYKYSLEDFKDYIELWCHEIKTPLSTTKLIIDNNRNNITNSILEEIERIESNIEQVLYYARSEEVEKDYIICKTNLKDICNNIIKRNKKDLINKRIKIKELKDDLVVESDSKWLEYIINQIVLNSIKYSKNNKSLIEFYYNTKSNSITLSIKDNGIGIKSNELDKVFNKGFTGSNGRSIYNSTGFGLYLCKKLCNRLNHELVIDSLENEYTIVSIIFPIDKTFNELDI